MGQLRPSFSSIHGAALRNPNANSSHLVQEWCGSGAKFRRKRVGGKKKRGSRARVLGLKICD